MNGSLKSLSFYIRISAGVIILYLSGGSSLFGQTSIGGIINTVSSRIDSICAFNNTDVDSLYVNSVSGFSEGDTVLVHMTVGASFYTSGGNVGNMSARNNSGKYAIFIIKEIDAPNQFIILNSTLPGFTPFLEGESGQIVKVPTYKTAVITSTLTCEPYDPVKGTGGILVMMVKGNLIFESDINVDGKGFPGAVPDIPEYSGTCSSEDPAYSNLYFNSSQSNYAALKGYSVASTTSDMLRGRGAISNGGGGGNGRYAGGGGGANGGDGGKGGNESASCGSTDLGGSGGKATTLYYKNDGLNCISLGGGGGTSTQNPDQGRIATAGGSGGGIVMIVCDSLIGHGGVRNIYARGESVTDSSSAGAGGGGAGGVIVLHINKQKTRPKFWVTGGNGGSVSSLVTDASGPGGGGGSGMIWHNRLSIAPETGWLTSGSWDFSFGENGYYRGEPNGAISGSNKIPLGNLIIPIRGFLFNYIPDADTICKFGTPKTINAAPPVGGTGVFTYNWMQSEDSIIWTDAAGVRNQATYTPPPGTLITMYYKRAVDNAGLIRDTSNVVKMFVMPPLVNNIIYPDTTICANLTAGTLYSLLEMEGGNGSYQYTWELSESSTFSAPEAVGTTKAYPTPALTLTSWYRRVVRSGPPNTCISYSDSVKITVLPVITNNILSEDQEICTTRTPEQLTGGAPGGGAGPGTYLFNWQRKNSSSWTNLVTTPTYQPPALTTSQEYRRIVISGPANTCRDTSELLILSVMPDITDNTINPITQNILCSGLNGEILTATTPQNGNGTYNYYWQRNGINAPGGDVMTDFDPGILTSLSVFRRIVTSGTNPDSLQRCWSISNERQVSILENITNNLISLEKTTWCQGKTPDDITGLEPQNGDGTYSFEWISRIGGNTWEDEGQTTSFLNTPVVTASTDYRRVVRSGLNGTCIDSSNLVTLIMQDSILNNRINDNLTVFVCYDEDSSLQATFPGVMTGGDESVYSYLWLQSSDPSGIYTDATETLNTTALYLTEPIQTSRYYKRRVISGDCQNISDGVKVEPLPLPELISLGTRKDEICFNKLDSVISVSIESGLPPYIVTYSDGLGFTDSREFSTGNGLIKPDVDDPTLPAGYLDYTFRIQSVIDSKSCLAKADQIEPFSAELRVYTKPLPIRISDEKTEECTSSLQLEIEPSIGQSKWIMAESYGVTAEELTLPAVQLVADYTIDDSVAAVFKYVENIANCASDTLEMDVIMYNTPDPIVNMYKVIEDSSVLVGDTVVIFISDNQVFSGEKISSGVPGWSIVSGAGELSDPGNVMTLISGLEQDDPTFLEYRISNGICPANQRTLKIERKELLVYDGFSPNNDGVNDELWSVGLADEEVDFKFQLFSSSGSFIREINRNDIKEVDLANNQVVLWDGTTNLGGAGNFVPDGTYYYVLLVTYHNESFNKRGYVIVKR